MFYANLHFMLRTFLRFAQNNFKRYIYFAFYAKWSFSSMLNYCLCYIFLSFMQNYCLCYIFLRFMLNVFYAKQVKSILIYFLLFSFLYVKDVSKFAIQ